MTGKSPVTARDEQKTALKTLAGGVDRAEADRARAILLTLDGWTSSRIAHAFGVREDTVRLWRSDFMRGGINALRASVAPGPMPLKAQAALRVAGPLLSKPVADRTNWTLARLADEIAARENTSISRRLKLRKAQAEAGDIVLLFADESEALTHPYLARGANVYRERQALTLGPSVAPISACRPLDNRRKSP